MELCIYGTESNQQACVDSEYNLQGTEDNIRGTQPPMDGQCGINTIRSNWYERE